MTEMVAMSVEFSMLHMVNLFKMSQLLLEIANLFL